MAMAMSSWECVARAAISQLQDLEPRMQAFATSEAGWATFDGKEVPCRFMPINFR